MKSLSLVFLAIALTATSTLAQFPVFPAADRVIGAPDFTTQGSTTVSATSLRSPSGLAIDPVSGKLFVASSTQHRILRYADVASLANGSAAKAVIGQGSYTTTTPGATATTLNEPRGLHVDGSRRLWVADSSHHRVLLFSSDRGTAPPTLTGKAPKRTTKAKLVLKGTATDPNVIAAV